MGLKFVDLFCGIGGFRIAAEYFGWQCVFSSDIDKEACRTYEANFGERPSGDITNFDEKSIPEHDILFAGFPCQPFSIIGQMNGMSDTRGTLFFDIARILKEKRPRWFLLENVKQLVGHEKGHTFSRILEIIKSLDYEYDWHILNALNFGLPQKRERVFIVGSNTRESFSLFEWPKGGYQMKPLSEILEDKVSEKYYASQYIQQKRLSTHQSKYYPSIWHENKSGHISSYNFSCALRANASYNYLLVNGIRRLTTREQLRLQGFPDWFKLISNDGQVRKQTGNSLPVPIVKAIIKQIIIAEGTHESKETKDKAKTKSRTAISLEPVTS